MCLLLNKTPFSEATKQKVAKKDIECYKVLFDDGTNPLTMERSYISPVRHEIYKLGETHYSDSFGEVMKYASTAGYRPAVAHGIHTYASFNAAKTGGILATSVSVIVKCVIPKGERYYEGFANSLDKAYASNSIIVGKDIEWCSLDCG